MKQPKYYLENGVRVVTHATLGETEGYSVAPKHMTVRKPNQKGVIAGIVPGHGGDVYWVEHEGSDETGAYCFTEFELA
jgi:hypothetical protein